MSFFHDNVWDEMILTVDTITLDFLTKHVVYKFDDKIMF